jgi:uncharacterized membrane protein
MNARAAAFWTGVSAGVVLASLVGCQQGLQNIDLTLSAAIDNDFSRAGDYKADFGMVMALMIAVSTILFCLFFVIFLLKNARES